MSYNLTRQRLVNQNISSTGFTTPEELLSAMGPIQAQDYPGSLWSIGIRLKNVKEKEIEEAIAAGKIIRTWPMRGTIHFVNAEDVRWIMKLLTPRIISGNKARLERMGLDEKLIAKSRNHIEKNLQGGKILTREQLYDILVKANLPVKNQLGMHILWRLAQEGLICFGPKQGKKYTFTLLDEWIHNGKDFSRDEAMAGLANRYFLSRGPATVKDFAWWTGLNLKEASVAIESASSVLEKIKIRDTVYLRHRDEPANTYSRENTVYMLSGFDEYMVAYRDRSSILDPAFSNKAFYGLVTPKIIINGLIGGSWKKTTLKNKMIIGISLFDRRYRKMLNPIRQCAEKFGKFLNSNVEIKIMPK